MDRAQAEENSSLQEHGSMTRKRFTLQRSRSSAVFSVPEDQKVVGVTKELQKNNLTRMGNWFMSMEKIDPSFSVAIHGVLGLESTITKKQLSKLLRDRLLIFERFRCNIVGVKDNEFVWEEQYDIDPADHIVESQLPADKNDESAVHDYANNVLLKKFTYEIPPWEIHLLQGYKGKGSAVIAKIHHSIADGTTCMMVLLSLCDPVEGEEVVLPAQMAAKKQAPLFTRLYWKFMYIFLILHTIFRVFIEPNLKKFDTKTKMHIPVEAYSNDKKLCRTAKSIKVKEIKQLSHKYNVTINDSLFAILGGAYRRYLDVIEDPQRNNPELRARGLMPINLRARGSIKNFQFGNKIGMTRIELYTEEKTFASRVKKMHSQTEWLKHSPEVYVGAWLQSNIIKWLDAKQIKAQMDEFLGLSSTVLTNNPGPVEPVAFAGARLENVEVYFAAAGLPFCVGVVSYNGSINICLSIDPNAVTKPDEFVQCFDDEYQAALQEANIKLD